MSEALADGLAIHIARWARRRGAPEAAAAAAEAAARALAASLADGHVCLRLDELPTDQPDLPTDAPGWRRSLMAAAVTGTPEVPGALPLLLDAEGRLYLQRQFDQEKRLARRLVQLAGVPLPPPGEAAAAMLRALFPPPGADGAPDGQQLAAALALRQRLVVVSGGPGTGKTTTVVNLLACVLAERPDTRIALAAPTGKAAARMTEAIRQRAGHLPAASAARLPTEAYTLHRLLGAGPRGFDHDAANPLPWDLLVVDEASMLDLALAARLFDALPTHARVVLLGDQDQLAAVESGAVFAELSADPSLTDDTGAALARLCGTTAAAIAPPAPRAAGALRDTAVWLTRSHRFAADSGIGALAEAIRSGRGDRALAALAGGPGRLGDLRHLPDRAAQPEAGTWQAMTDGFASYVAAIDMAVAAAGTAPAGVDGPAAVATAFAAFGRFRVLCAVREGPRGVGAVNQRLERNLRQRGTAAREPGASAWYPGRPVMVLRNDPVLRLFNGDIGLALPAADGTLQVWFADADGGHRAVSPARLPAHQTAFATTVHKSQGSEFDAVLVLLPASPGRVLTRELLYTAVTRARRQVTLAAGADVLAAAIARPTRRHSGLPSRLRDALADHRSA